MHGYEDSYSDDMKAYVEGEATLSELVAGDSITTNIAVSIAFNDLSTTKTIKIELFDADSSSTTAIKTATKDFKITNSTS